MHNGVDKSLIYLLIFTAISSFLAYRIVVKAYDGILDTDYEAQIVRTK